MPQKFISQNRQKRSICYTFNNDFYQNSFNFFIHAMHIKTLPAKSINISFLALQLINQSKKPLSIADMIKQISLLNLESDELINIDSNTFRRSLDKLVKAGYIESNKINLQHRFQPAQNPLTNLTAEELKELFFAVAFAANTSLLSVPGYYLLETIQTILLQNHHQDFSPHNIYQFKHNLLTRMLDDIIIYPLLKNFSNSEFKIETKLRAFSIRPIKIISEYMYNRQHLLAQTKKNHITLRIDQILDLQSIGKKAEQNEDSFSIQYQTPSKKIKEKPIILHFHADKILHNSLLARIKNELPPATINAITEQGFNITIHHINPQDLIPQLRTFYPYVEVKSLENTTLRNKVKEDLEEVLRNYGIIS